MRSNKRPALSITHQETTIDNVIGDWACIIVFIVLALALVLQGA